MKDLIKNLKQQPRHGGVPRRPNIGAQALTRDDGCSDSVNNQVQQLAMQLANEMIAAQQQAQLLARNGRVFTKFDQLNDVVANQTEVVTAGLWSDNIASLTTYFTSSTQTTTQRRY